MCRKQRQPDGTCRKNHFKRESGHHNQGANLVCIRKKRGLPFLTRRMDRRITYDGMENKSRLPESNL